MATADDFVQMWRDLRDSVRDYRDPRTTALERHEIREWWRSLGVENQMHAMLLAARLNFKGGLPNDRERLS